MKTEPNEPINAIVGENYYSVSGERRLETKFNGLTKRELFALEFTKAIMIGIISGSGKDATNWTEKDFAIDGIKQADEFINQLNQG